MSSSDAKRAHEARARALKHTNPTWRVNALAVDEEHRDVVHLSCQHPQTLGLGFSLQTDLNDARNSTEARKDSSQPNGRITSNRASSRAYFESILGIGNSVEKV